MVSLQIYHLSAMADLEDPEFFEDDPQLDLGGDDLDSSCSEEEDSNYLAGGLSVTREEVSRNLQMLKGSMATDPPVHTLVELRLRHPEAFTEESEETLASVLAENHLQYELSDYQVCDL